MKILALEFSSPERSVAAFDSGLSGDEQPIPELVETGSRSMQPLSLIERVLTQARLVKDEIDCLAVGLGPGSYTGIRAAIALAQGWQLARSIKLLGISSVECIAMLEAQQGGTGRFHVIVDAQRNELYRATYECEGGHYQERGPLRVITLAEARKEETLGHTLIGPEANRWFPNARLVFPRASTLAHMALHRTDFVAGETLEPIYLRETTFVKAPPQRHLPGPRKVG